MSAAISVRGLEKAYGDLEVLRGVDLDVAKGSIFALLGSNGAGKTTLVRTLCTLLKPDAGTATVNGFDVNTQPAGGLPIALAWCVGILLLAYPWAVAIFRKRVAG